MDKLAKLAVITTLAVAVSGCVTQTYEDGKTPIVETESNNKDIAMTRIHLGLGYLKIGNTAQAKLNLERAKKAAPRLIEVHTAFAHYYETVGEPELATAAYEQALSIDSDDADTLNNYGVFLCRQENYELAEEKILAAIAVPSYILVAKSYENLALCQLKGQRFDKAEQYLEKAILHSPSSASILLQMVTLQYAKGEYRTGQHYYSRYEKATRRFTAEGLALGYKIFEKQNNRRVAKNYAAMLLKMFPESYEAKQYILNGLVKINADELAEQYQAKEGKQLAPKVENKRVVVLSPKNNSRNNEKQVTKADALNRIADENKQVDKLKASAETKKLAQATIAKVKPAEDKNVTLSTETNELAKPVIKKVNSTKRKKVATVSENNGQRMMTIPIHVVKGGDSLFSISKKYNIQMKALMRWNNIKKSKLLRIGDVIHLSDPKKAAKS